MYFAIVNNRGIYWCDCYRVLSRFDCQLDSWLNEIVGNIEILRIIIWNAEIILIECQIVSADIRTANLRLARVAYLAHIEESRYSASRIFCHQRVAAQAMLFAVVGGYTILGCDVDGYLSRRDLQLTIFRNDVITASYVCRVTTHHLIRLHFHGLRSNIRDGLRLHRYRQFIASLQCIFSRYLIILSGIGQLFAIVWFCEFLSGNLYFFVVLGNLNTLRYPTTVKISNRNCIRAVF